MEECMKFEKGLYKLELPFKALITFLLLTLALGYIFALYTIYLTHKDADSEPGLSMKDIIYMYSGNKESTTLETVSNGSMATYYATKDEKDQVIAWIRAGASEAEYDAVTAPIFKKSCTICHSPMGVESSLPLTTYDEVMKYVEISTGMPPIKLGTISHTHLISHGVMFFLLSLIFLFTAASDRLKILFISAAFFSISLDVVSWWLSKISSAFAYFSVVSGSIMGICFLLFFFMPLYEMWMKKAK